jgi:hypothetical protein
MLFMDGHWLMTATDNTGGALFPEQVEKECQNNADNDACGDGEEKSEMVFLDEDVTRELPKPRNLGC